MSEIRIQPVKKKKDEENIRIQPLEETNHAQNYNLNGTKLAPISKSIINGINNRGIKERLNTTLENLSQTPLSTPKEKIDLSGKSYFKDTGKTYGDYYYDNYAQNKDKKIYINTNDKKYYINTNGKYQRLNKLDENGNIISDNVMTTTEIEKQKKQEAIRQGYKDNSSNKITSQEYDNAQSTFKKLQKEYKLTDKELNEFIETGNLNLSNISVITKEKNKIREDAIKYREKLKNKEIDKYDSDKTLTKEQQIYLDTTPMSEEEKNQYINFLTGKYTPVANNDTGSYFKIPNVLKDGYQPGDISKAILGTATSIGSSALTGIGNFVENTSDFITNLVGTGLETMFGKDGKTQITKLDKNNKMLYGYKYGNQNFWLDKDKNILYDDNGNLISQFNINNLDKQKEYKNDIAKLGSFAKEVVNNENEVSNLMMNNEVFSKLRDNSILGNKSEAMVQSMTETLPTMALGAAGAGQGTTAGMIFETSYARAKSDAIQQGYSESNAIKSALSSAMAETISEQFFEGVPGMKVAGWGEKLVDNIALGTEKYFGSKAGKIVSKALSISGEGFEEIISNALNAANTDFIHHFYQDFDIGNQTGNISKDVLKELTSKESWEAFTSAIITSAILNTGTAIINHQQQKNIISAYAEDRNISYAEAKKMLLNSNNSQKVNNSETSSINIPRNITETNLNKELSNNSINTSSETKSPEIMPKIAYQYISTNNEKINTLRKSASQYLNNSVESQNLVNTIEKVVQDKNYNIVFDNKIKNKFGKEVNAKISALKNGEIEIKLNPNSDRAGEFLLVHEITHAIETNDMKDLVLKYANQNKQFNESLESLKQTYGTEDVSSEVIADISGQLFGNQEFINNLSTKQPNIFKRIYNKIIELANKITRNTKEGLFIKDLKNKWEEAYKNSNKQDAFNNLNSETEYHTSKNIWNDISNALNGYNTDSHVMLRDYTPKQLVSIGIEDLPMMANVSHLKENILTLDEAKNKGLSVVKGKHYHGLGIDTYIKAVDSLDNPIAIYQWQSNNKNKYNENNYVILTNIKDSNGLKIIVPIEINKKGNYNNVELDINKINTIYGKGNIYNYFLNNVSDGSMKLIYQKRSNTNTLQSGTNIASTANNIPQSNNNVNSDISSTKYSMQNHENNTQELDNSSFSVLKNSNGKEIDISNLKENSTMERFHYNRKYDKNSIVTYRGEGENTGYNPAFYGLGLYTTLDSKYAKKYGNVSVVDNSLLPDNPLKFKTQNDFHIWEQELARELGIRKRELYSNDYGVEQYIKKLGYDGLMIGVGKDTDLISFKDVAIKYSQQNDKWQEHLEKNYKSSGTITYFENIRKNKVNPPIIRDGVIVNKIQDQTQNRNEKDIIKETRNQKIEERVNKAIQTGSYKALGEATKAAKKYLDFSMEENNEFKSQLEKYKNATYEQLANPQVYNEIRDLVSKYANREIKYIDEDLKSVKSEIRSVRIKVDENLRKQITDYSDFRKSNFGKLNLTNETGISVDALWNDLKETYPHYFNNKVNTEADMLYELSDFMNKDITLTEKYRLHNEELESITSKVFNELKNQSLTKEEIENLQKSLQNKYERKTRQVVMQELLSEMRIDENDISFGKDINSINYQMTDPIRLNEKVFGQEIGKKINEATIEKTKHNTAQKIRWLNKEREEISAFGIKARSKESAAVQKYAEGKYVNKYDEVVEYNDHDLMAEFPNSETQEKIKRVAYVLRSKYDEYLDQINGIITELGYDPIPKRKDYMRHFQELGDVFSQSGVPFNLNDMKAEDLPTDINGLTEFNKPGKSWFASTQKRTGVKSNYDAITGIDGYLEGAANLIFHTEDIQRYRTLSKFIRNNYGQTHGFENLNKLSEKEAKQRIADIQSNKLSKYVAWLDEQANSLAGKKGAIDRGVERAIGRRAYAFFNLAKKQVGSNMTGYNVRSSLTNLISSTIASSKTNKIALVKGTISTINNYFKKDGFIDKSDFLTARFGSDNLSQKVWQKISNAGQIFMNGTDYLTANLITRSKYYEGLQKGMSESDAIKYADDFGARVMGDRSQGSTAEIFNSKTLGLFTQFQLEVNNQWQYMIHDTKVDFQRNSQINGGLKAGATALFQLGQLAAYSYFFNQLFESLTGSRAAFDPVDIFKTLFSNDGKKWDEKIAEANKELVDNIPFGNIITGGGRIPVSEAFTGLSTLGKKLTNQTDAYGGEITWEQVGKDILKTMPYYALPTGYGQIKKTVKGLSMFSKDKPIPGSYTDSGRLRFPVKDTFGKRIQAGLFGGYASEEAREYMNGNYVPLKEEQQVIYKCLDVSLKDYHNTNDQIKKIKKKYKNQNVEFRKHKIFEYIDSLNLTEDQKNLYKKLQYPSYHVKNVSIREYLKSLNLTKEEKKEIYKQLNFDK